MVSSEADLFCDAVSRSALRRDVNLLAEPLKQVRFEPVEAFLIAAAVALTRDFPLPRAAAFPGLAYPSNWQEKSIDALAVMFMFNVVNRIANAFELEPEWDGVSHTEWIRARMQVVMSIGLPMLMPLDNDPLQPDESCTALIEPLLRQLGIVQISSVWQHLGILPTVEFAIYRLLWVSVTLCKTDERMIEEVLLPGPQSSSKSLPGPGPLFWKRLLETPYLVQSGEGSECNEIDAETKVDVAFRVALLGGIRKLNSPAAAQLLEESATVGLDNRPSL